MSKSLKKNIDYKMSHKSSLIFTYDISHLYSQLGFLVSSAGKESSCKVGDPPGLGRSPGEGIGYPLQYSWASLVAQMIKNLPAMPETWVRSLGWEDPQRRAWQPIPVLQPGESTWTEDPRGLATVHGVPKSWTQVRD